MYPLPPSPCISPESLPWELLAFTAFSVQVLYMYVVPQGYVMQVGLKYDRSSPRLRSLLLHLSYHSHDSCMPLLMSIFPALRALYCCCVSSFLFEAVNLGVFVFIPLRKVSTVTFPGAHWHLNCSTMLLFILCGFVLSFPPDPCWLVHSNVRNDLPLTPLWKKFWNIGHNNYFLNNYKLIYYLGDNIRRAGVGLWCMNLF